MAETMSFEREPRKSQASEAQHYITIQIRMDTTDEEGGFTSAWEDVQVVSASILPIQARQQFEYKSINVDASHLIRIRGLVAVSETINRILWGSRIFEILTVENIQERSYIKVLTCLEKRPNG
jgi:SPP1 family predicted phage head-tail adaptor